MFRLPVIPPQVKWIAAAIVLAGTFIAGIRWERGQEALDEVKMQAVEDRAQKGAATAIAKNKPINRYYGQEQRNEVQSDPVYTDCVLPDAGVQNLNAVVEGRPIPPGDRELPEADTFLR